MSRLPPGGHFGDGGIRTGICIGSQTKNFRGNAKNVQKKSPGGTLPGIQMKAHGKIIPKTYSFYTGLLTYTAEKWLIPYTCFRKVSFAQQTRYNTGIQINMVKSVFINWL